MRRKGTADLPPRRDPPFGVHATICRLMDIGVERGWIVAHEDSHRRKREAVAVRSDILMTPQRTRTKNSPR